MAGLGGEGLGVGGHGVGFNGSGEGIVKKKRGRPPYKHLLVGDRV
jgi:hypothetical protein